MAPALDAPSGLAYPWGQQASTKRQSMTPETEPPFNPLPPVVIALAVVILGIELLFTLAQRGIIGGPEAVGWRLTAIRDFGFFDPVFDWMIAHGSFPMEHLRRFVTYPLIHMNFTHAVFVAIFILAIGKMVGEVLGNLAVFSLFFFSASGSCQTVIACRSTMQ